MEEDTSRAGLGVDGVLELLNRKMDSVRIGVSGHKLTRILCSLPDLIASASKVLPNAQNVGHALHLLCF